MGTRGMTRVVDEQGRPILNMYSQYDGYPRGLGAELHKKLGHLELVNGIGSNEKVANGMGCFAAQVVAAVKDRAGGFYIHAPSDDLGGIEFIYDFRPNKPGHPTWAQGQKEERHLMLKVTACYFDNRVLYDGPFADFDPAKAQKLLSDEPDEEQE